ncbi:tRNA-guanine transglycosylase family protein [Aulographum hederae CBS 113979]|uniref:Queuine tRNA-ribosyltransferase accessory subunit 2 n=1 Tax=Aulographum hederae CBS 113979 TaxID=1176131 RepID=A0A6G1HD50_9PEZI|nr:tRNA-guanine transglycosylase family protein [Aulographum hederae CBS 113979]
MANIDSEKLSQLPCEMLSFNILKAPAEIGPRLGKFALPNRRVISTPHYVGISSRGVVPHLSPDMLKKRTNIDAVYFGLEDFTERLPIRTPPLYNVPTSEAYASKLKSFTVLPDDRISILGPRRIPAVETPKSNTKNGVSIHTSVGFAELNVRDYVTAMQILSPDIIIGLADVPQGDKPSSKRADKMDDRTCVWTRDMIVAEAEREVPADTPRPQIFAPILPTPIELQMFYMDHLVEDDMLKHISGLAIYNASNTPDLPYQLLHLPRLAMTEPSSPRKLLYDISLGTDLFTIPFTTAASDAGIALSFSFPATSPSPSSSTPLPLGIDMWSPTHATSLTPLSENCTCHTCTSHHRAYVQHLLSAKEMLGWVLLQIHNHAVLDRFFSGVRASIANGTFDEDRLAFEKLYEDELPAKTGLGPRVRGYQYRSERAGESKRNPSAFRMLDDGGEKLEEAQVEEGAVPSPGVDERELEEKGFAKPV